LIDLHILPELVPLIKFLSRDLPPFFMPSLLSSRLSYFYNHITYTFTTVEFHLPVKWMVKANGQTASQWARHWLTSGYLRGLGNPHPDSCLVMQ